MKKNLLWMFAVVAIVVVSCQKEKEIVPNEEEIEVTPPAIDDDAIPTVITGTILDDATKTAYAEDGKFTWVSSDRVRLLTCESLETYSKIGIYTYMIKEGGLTNDNKSAVFTSTSSAGDLIDFVNGTWKSTGIAMYPTSALDRFETPESHSYGTPWFTLARKNVSGAKSDILLTGVKVDAINNFKFSTAMAVLKITLRNIPANAVAIKLCTSDKTNYPVDGDFALSRNGDLVDMTFLPAWVSDFKGYQKVDISAEGEISERTLYFNIPAAEYPANTLSLLIEDANGGQIMKRTIGAKMNIARNECLELPALSYSYSVAFKKNCLASDPYITYTFDCKRIRFCVSTSPTIDITAFNNGYTFANDLATGSSSGEYRLSSFSSQKPSETGLYYMHFIFQSDRGGLPASLTDANVVGTGTIPFYYISSTDESTFAKQYNFTKTDGTNFWHPGTSIYYSTTMTLAVSNDVNLGNLMITELYGKDCTNKKVYGILSSTDAESMTFAYNGNEPGQYFLNANTNYFYVAQADSHNATAANDDIVFTIADGPALTCEKYLFMKYTSDYSSWGEFISGVGLVFN